MLERNSPAREDEVALFDFDEAGALSETPRSVESIKDKQLDHLVDTAAAPNYMVAREMMEYETEGGITPEQSAPEEALRGVKGVSISLAERAFYVGEIMDGISKENKAAGASQAVQYDNSFTRRYSDPNYVADVMSDKARGYKAQEARLIEGLTKSEQLREVGFSDEEVELAAWGIKSAIRKLRKTGPHVAAMRRKQKAKTQKTYEKVRDGIARLEAQERKKQEG